MYIVTITNPLVVLYTRSCAKVGFDTYITFFSNIFFIKNISFSYVYNYTVGNYRYTGYDFKVELNH